MATEQCFIDVCFISLDGNEQRFFGFSEFLAGLALMVLAWTIADIRYRFRVRTAPIPLIGITFGIVTTIGVLTLLTDLWRAEQWLVPKSNLFTLGLWQALLGGTFLFTFLTWAWFAFMRPPVYSRHNAERFTQTLYRFILKGSAAELAVIADELTGSAGALVHHATNRDRLRSSQFEREEGQNWIPPQVEGHANGLLLLIADKRLCRAIVDSSPGTALAIFCAIAETKKYGVQIEIFAKNVVHESLANKDSFLYHEAEGYESGLIGYHKPLSQAMFANYDMVEAIGTMLDPDLSCQPEWDADQWEAYCRIVLLTLRSYVKDGGGGHSYALYRAKGYIEQAASDLYKLNGLASIPWNNDLILRLQVVVEFIKESVKILNEKGVPNHICLRLREEAGHQRETFYDHIASLIFEVIFHAAAVRSPQWECWWIQHNSVWGKLFRLYHLDGPAGQVVKFKVRRLLYNEVANMSRLPNFKGARVLGYCLNVMGLVRRQGNYDKDSQAIQKAILAWTRKNYAWLHEYNPRISEACLMDGMTYDVDNQQLVGTRPATGLRREPSYVYLELDPAPPKPEEAAAP